MSVARTYRRFRNPLFAIVLAALGGAFALHTAYAVGSMPITGYAWSSNIGWISFSGAGYGVNEDKTTGALSGYAWASDFGWISFNWTDGSHPAPAVNFVDGKVSGWARACSVFADKNTCVGALDANAGGWDGWIALRGTANDSSVYGIVQSPTCVWSGYAWGSDVVGAINTSGVAGDSSPYSVTGNDPGTCSGQLVVACTGSPASPFVNQQVTYSCTIVSGGTGPYTYSWSGTDGLTGSTATVFKTYSTAGVKTATVLVTDTSTSKTANVTATNIGNGQPSTTINACTSTLTATPSTVNQGQNTSLSWSVSDPLCASSCSGSGFNTAGALSGTVNATVVPAPPTTSYALTCVAGTYGPPPPANASVTVIVPTVTVFSVNNQSLSARVIPGAANNVRIIWSAANSTSCSVTKNGVPWSSGVSSAGINDTISIQTVYKIDCVNDQGTHVVKSITVNIQPNFGEF